MKEPEYLEVEVPCIENKPLRLAAVMIDLLNGSLTTADQKITAVSILNLLLKEQLKKEKDEDIEQAGKSWY